MNINFDVHMTANVQQEHFLANQQNKAKLIHLLVETLMASGVEATVALGDADVPIIQCALNKYAGEPVVVVGEDTDLLVILVALTPSTSKLFFLKPGRGSADNKLYCSQDIQHLSFSGSLLFIHSFSGCDTTSAIYNRSKATMVKLFQKNPDKCRAIADIFYNPQSTPEGVVQAGEEMFLMVYQALPSEHDLDHHRYRSFVKSTSKVKTNLASLPPTKTSARQHSLRVFHQVQMWLLNPLPPEEWGWKRGSDGDLIPIKNTAPPTPNEVLSTIFCRCSAAGGCGQRCGCRKGGIFCSTMCAQCQGACTNTAPVEVLFADEEELIDEPDDEDDF